MSNELKVPESLSWWRSIVILLTIFLAGFEYGANDKFSVRQDYPPALFIFVVPILLLAAWPIPFIIMNRKVARMRKQTAKLRAEKRDTSDNDS